ncbi:type III secretion system export apparatus subunit SctR [Roseateles sp. SL47]|uniref:type III secretion system export apparatus subunit SctR n=1 Tax=Roseateles sp. SL47 TaxID=2995138 RepID=UPI0022705637|nr:type III secretion system export apparatus subunit SctR [Roseateles sp. SL47]WAC75792.1 type III secretion system export apparatus subunit SctR [Roseateles sp. SL47]
MDGLSVTLLLAALSLLPLLIVSTTAFLKIVIVLMITRNAIGVQQVPPSIAVYGIAMMMTAFVMAPTLQTVAGSITQALQERPQQQWQQTASRTVEPLRQFMLKYAKPEDREQFLDKARKLWPPEQAAQAKSDDFFILVPAFMISEIQAGFEMGFLIYIPFLVIDLIVSNLLLALGMQMVSPMTISLPLKLFLFVAVDGWGKLLRALLDSYL